MKILKITFREQGYKAHHLGNMDPREGLITLDKRKYQIDIFVIIFLHKNMLWVLIKHLGERF